MPIMIFIHTIFFPSKPTPPVLKEIRPLGEASSHASYNRAFNHHRDAFKMCV